MQEAPSASTQSWHSCPPRQSSPPARHAVPRPALPVFPLPARTLLPDDGHKSSPIYLLPRPPKTLSFRDSLPTETIPWEQQPDDLLSLLPP
ncbi:hypothetical protein E2C01_083681 [Portunus trituberculatus]|uniref:Uncharacterized protein n=1 Tax=Portunus trituberculatus TaxID=210409 RepID=A0A5B7IT35_PORTR|nr:hypothetical protein [Portunus trituberculatus]